MKAAFIKIAQAKTVDLRELELLRAIETRARAFEEAQASLPDRITANKASRGEAPTRLSRGERAQLAELAQDQTELDADLLQQLSALDSAQAVIGALHFGLSLDLPMARQMLKHYAPADRVLGEEVVALEEALAAAMAAYLAEFPAPA